ncbi:MAG: CtsR family transcriptional regulator [Acutalibacteraceae bacterium]|nr:CtsR family transcriptional regulator [Acutalibacteraceae bacterium]
MLLSDIITKQILEELAKSESGIAEIQRNLLAEVVGCVPSQINYVISSRFTPERGYLVESRRGGGGYIRITEIRNSQSADIMHAINSIGNEIDMKTCRIIVENLLYREYINKEIAKIIIAACSDEALTNLPIELKDSTRASILKRILMTQA